MIYTILVDSHHNDGTVIIIFHKDNLGILTD